LFPLVAVVCSAVAIGPDAGIAEISGIASLPNRGRWFACIERLLNGDCALLALAVALVVPLLDVFGLD